MEYKDRLRWNYVILLSLFFLESCTQNEERPNVILIMTDDQGWYDVGFNGNQEIQTPWLDSLASLGLIFDRFYSASAVCSPTRASFITGRNPLRMNIPTANSGHMPKEEITLAELLRSEGYATGHFGKWHLGTFTKSELDANRGGKSRFDADYTIPSEHGYETFFATESKVPTYDPMILPVSFNEGEGKRFGWRARTEEDSTSYFGTFYWNNSGKVSSENLKGDDSKIIIDEVLKFVDAADGRRPFFTTVWLHTPHLPVVADTLHRALYSDLNLDKQIYYGSISAMDEEIGRLWTHLGELGIQNETVIMFCSDNGPERQTPGSAGIFRARKRSLYEGGLRVPAFAVYKEHFGGGDRTDFPAFTSDYLPTVLDILGMEVEFDRPMDGISLLGTLSGNKVKRDKAMGFIYGKQITWVGDRYKLKTDENLDNVELYDLHQDKSESNSISASRPDLVADMMQGLEEWLSSVRNSAEGGDY